MIEVKKDRKYWTKDGHRVKCVSIKRNVALCFYLDGRVRDAWASQWFTNGEWISCPGESHDIIAEIVREPAA